MKIKDVLIGSIFYAVITSVQVSNPKIEIIFAVKVAYQSNGDMLSFQAMLRNNGRIKARKKITRKEFIHIASGDWPSLYNREEINYFEQNNVEGGIYIDSITQEKIPYCFALDSLWKIRFNQYPFRGKNEEGWSKRKFKPSASQTKYLYEEYGLTNIDSKSFADTSFWKILRDVRREEWIANYKGL